MNDQPKQMDQKDLDFFKKLLLEKIAQTSDDVEAIENTSRNDARETASEDRSTYSLHMADHGTDAMEREKSLLLAPARWRLHRLLKRGPATHRGRHLWYLPHLPGANRPRPPRSRAHRHPVH